jgi:hypothetical protein
MTMDHSQIFGQCRQLSTTFARGFAVWSSHTVIMDTLPKGAWPMDGSDRDVLDAIEYLTQQLINLYEKHHCLTDPNLIEYSQNLDRLIVDWCRGKT